MSVIKYFSDWELYSTLFINSRIASILQGVGTSVRFEQIKSNKQETNYYLDTGHLMFHYYDKFKSQHTDNVVYYRPDSNNKMNVFICM